LRLAGRRVCYPDHGQAIGLREGKCAKEDGTDNAENRAVRADREGKGQHRHRGKAWIPAQLSQSVTKVLE
jgi:hypothetical protein